MFEGFRQICSTIFEICLGSARAILYELTFMKLSKIKNLKFHEMKTNNILSSPPSPKAVKFSFRRYNTMINDLCTFQVSIHFGFK